MDTSLPPTPTGLWPEVDLVTSYRPKGGKLTLEIPGLSEAPLLTVLSRAIHLEMRAAGEWAASVGSASDKDRPWYREFSCHSAEDAARLLALYTALHSRASYLSTRDLSPEALKASASRCYATALRHEQARRQGKDITLFPPVSTQP